MHSETGPAPLARRLDGIPSPLPRPTPAALREAFLWSEFRTVTKTATVSLHGNDYQVDELLVGRKVELVFDPFDLTELGVRYSRREFVGTAVLTASAATPTPRPGPSSPTQARWRAPRPPALRRYCRSRV